MATTINAGRVAMVPKGTYDESTAYERLDVVTYGGSSYISKVDDNLGNTPGDDTDYWMLCASVGEDGSVTIDDVPTEGSTNAVSSGGVYDALAGKQDASSGDVVASITGVPSNATDPWAMQIAKNASATRRTGSYTLGDGTTATFGYWDTYYNNATAYSKNGGLITEQKDGLMSGSDKTKMDTIESGAEVNVIESITINDVDATISSKAATLTLNGQDILLTTEDSEGRWAEGDAVETALQSLSIDISDKQNTISDLSTIRSGASKGATAYQKPNGGIPKSDLASSVQTSLGLADSALQQHQDLSSLADGAEYDSSEKKIYLKHGNTRLSNPIDATAFIKDGMIDTVTVTNGNLVISFNTDAGKQPISIPISDIFNANNYYTKTEIDNKGYLTSETDPVFTTSVAHGITSSDIANWNSKTSNVGTITGIAMNGASKGTSGVVDLGTVITEHQDISGKVDKETGKGLSSNDYTDAEKTKLSGIATGAEVNVQSDWNQTTTTADDYIKNKPSLATVATSGSYSDLSNKPTIPTVNNATLTIQKNGTTVGTFTANASSNVTANISVPTKVSDLTNDSGFITGYTETDPTVPSWAKNSTKPTYNGSEVNYTGTTGNVVTNNTTLNVAIKAIDDAIGNVETLLASI